MATKIRCTASTNKIGSHTEDVIEVEDDYSDDEIDEAVFEYLTSRSMISWNWERVATPEGDANAYD